MSVVHHTLFRVYELYEFWCDLNSFYNILVKYLVIRYSFDNDIIDL